MASKTYTTDQIDALLPRGTNTGDQNLSVAGNQITISGDNGNTVTIPVGSGSVADATTDAKGIVQLAGDLAGTANAPTVPGLTGKAPLLTVQAVSTATSGTLAPDTVNPVDATAAAATRTLPTPTKVGQVIEVEKTDSTSNTVTINGTIRDTDTSIALAWRYETIGLIAESLTSWRPIFGHKTKAALDAAYSAAAGVNPNDSGYDIVLLLGQSDMAGDSGGAIDPTIDITDPRIWSFGATGAKAGTIVQASDPLAQRSSGVGSNSTIVGPGMEFARWYAQTVKTNRRVLLVPSAYNGTGMLTGPNRWDPTNTWPNDNTNLYNLAITQAQAALAAAGANSRFVAALWVQGESDSMQSIAATSYRTALEYLIDGLRSRLNVPNLPFVIGSMTPEYLANYSPAGTKTAIDAVHVATPTRKAYTAFVRGPAGYGRGDNIHYAPAGQRIQGRQLVDGLTAALANTAPASAVPANPPALPNAALSNTAAPTISGSATTGSVLTTTNGSWSAVPDSYTYQWQRAGAAISGATSSTYTLVSADEGQAVTCVVTAVKSGFTTASKVSSNSITGASAGTPALSNTTAPAVTPTTGSVGTVLTTTNGSWSATPDSYTYQWLRAGSAISGATSASYTTVTADGNQAVTCSVTAVKSGYSSATTSSNSVMPTPVAGAALTDSFNRTDSTSSLGTADTGQTWQVLSSGTFGIASGQAYRPVAGTSPANDDYAVLETSKADIDMSITITAFGTAGAGPVFRATDVSNYWTVDVIPSTGIKLYKKVSGTYANAINLLTGTVAAAAVIRVVASGSSLAVYLNGAQVGSTVTDSFNSTATKHGFRIGGSNTTGSAFRLDSFSAA